MGLAINDKKIDMELGKVVKRLQNEGNIKHVSKTDALRYLLGIKKQGKKTNNNWKKLFK